MTRRLSTVQAALAIAIAAVLVTGLTLAAGTTSVGAQITCDAGTSSYQVSTSAELNAAGGDEPAGLGVGDIVADGEIKLNDALALAQLVG